MLRGQGGSGRYGSALWMLAVALSGCAGGSGTAASGGDAQSASGGRTGAGGVYVTSSGGSPDSGASGGDASVATGGAPVGSAAGAAGSTANGSGAAGRGSTGGSGGAGDVGAPGGGGTGTGPVSTGGSNTGGTVSTGGSNIGGMSTGGSGAGGAASTGGTGTAGAGGATAPTTCKAPQPGTGGTHICANTKGRTSSGYGYELWASGDGMGCMNVYGVNANYGATWTMARDFLSRAGRTFDSTKTPAQLGTISADFSETFTEVPVEGKTSKIYVALYGWTVEPLAEFYIIDDYGDFVPGPINSDGSPRTNYGTLTVDDGTYDIWAMPVKGRPAITGDNKDFTQIFNVRKERRKCGHISASEHFAKWSSLGLPVGKLEEAMFLMEAQNNSGTIDMNATVTVK